MSTVQYVIKIDDNLKKQAMEVARMMGLSLSALTKAFYLDLVKKKAVSLSLNKQTFDHVLEEAVCSNKVQASLKKFENAIQW